MVFSSITKKVKYLLRGLTVPIKSWVQTQKNVSRLKYLLKKVKPQNKLNATVVFNVTRNLLGSVNSEIYLGLKLALNGAKVIVLIDDGVMMHWDSTDIYQINNKYDKVQVKNHNPFYFNNPFDNIFSRYFFY